MNSSSPWSPREKKASRIIAFLETSGGTALITVVLGGIVGTMITSQWQDRIKQRELSLAAYGEYAKKEQEISQRAYELIGAGIAASDDLLTLTEPAFDLERYTGEERKKVATQREEIRETFNVQDRKWRTERETLGLLIGYYHHGQPEVIAAWQKAQDSITHYFDCVRTTYLNPPENSSTSAPCEAERKDFRQRLAEVTQSFEKARVHAWEVPGQGLPQ